MNQLFPRIQLPVIAAVSLLVFANAVAQDYQVIDLGVISQGKISSAFAVNDGGQVVGQAAADELSAQLHGFLWEGGVINDLATLPGNMQSVATAINQSGQVTGISYNLGSLQPQAFLWQGGVLTPLGPFTPNAINDAGNVVGTQDTLQVDGIWRSQAVLWDGATISGLGTLGGDNSYAHGINANGDIVGVSQLSDGTTTRAFFSASGPLSDLGTLGGVRSHAYAINEQRHVVGVADTSVGMPHAFLFKLNAQGQVDERIDLGELGGGNSYGFDINNSDVVVGTSNARAFVWKNNSMSDLNQLIPAGSGWRLDIAKSVNNTGWIAGYGRHLGRQRGFLLIPIGEVQVESFEITRGELVNGGLPELRSSDNIDLSAKRARADVLSRVFAIFRSTSPVANPSSLSFSIESAVFARSTVNQSVDLYDFGAGTWEQVYTGVASRFVDSTVLVDGPGSLSRFVEPGTNQIQARCRYESINVRQEFTANIDHVFWNIGN